MADGYRRELVWKEMLTSAVIFVRGGQAGIKRVQESGQSELPHFRNKRSQDTPVRGITASQDKDGICSRSSLE